MKVNEKEFNKSNIQKGNSIKKNMLSYAIYIKYTTKVWGRYVFYAHQGCIYSIKNTEKIITV